jgi:hypothetical protein
MFGLIMGKRASYGAFQISSLANSNPISCPSKVRSISRIVQKVSHLSLYCTAYSQKGAMNWFPEFYVTLDIIFFVFAYTVFGAGFLAVCAMRLGKVPRFMV